MLLKYFQYWLFNSNQLYITQNIIEKLNINNEKSSELNNLKS
jgi:hypothetical protein